MEKTILKEEVLKPENLRTLTLSIDKVCKLFFHENRVFRAVEKAYVEEVKEMFNSGMIQELLDNNLFVETWISDTKIEGYDLVLEHKNITYWNYPYEWSFNMLKDAAKAVLDVNIIANKYGYELFDVHAYNVVFDMATPKYIDFGSLFKIDPKNGKCWSGYLNFYNSFYMPLYLYKKGFSDLSQSLSLYNGFFNNKDFFKLRYKYLGLFGSKISGLFYKAFDNSRRLAVARHFRVIDKYGKHKHINRLLKFKKTFQNKYNVKRAYRLINKIKHSSFDSYWKDYHTNINPESNDRFLRITDIIKTDLGDSNSLVELASNQGKFANFVLANTQINELIATDYDKNALDVIYRNNKGSENVLPLLYDFVRPNARSVDQKIQNRVKGDIVMALAVTHHLILTQDIDLKHIFNVLKSHTKKYIVIEFMPLGLYSGDLDKTPPIPEYYTLDWFKEEFCNSFDHILDEELDINRHVFVGKLKN